MDITIFKHTWFIVLIAILAIWESVWKMVGLWRSARNNKLAWFICIAVINTIGILPMVYVLVIDKKGKED